MRIINIYTDGSHLDKQNNGRLGCGGVMIDAGKNTDEFSIELKPDWLRQNYGTDKVSNPSAEMLGLLMAIKEFDIPNDAVVVVHADYIGVKSWMEGTWKTKEPYLTKIKADIEKEIKNKNLDGRIMYSWVKGHQSKSIMSQDAKWNNYVDLLAKGQK